MHLLIDMCRNFEANRQYHVCHRNNMQTAGTYLSHVDVCPSFLSYTMPQHAHDTSVFSVRTPPFVYSSEIGSFRMSTSDDDNDDHSRTSSTNLAEQHVLTSKKRSRTIPDEAKDAIYYEKRARNNESAKRSRDTRRIKEEQIQERLNFLEHENTRLAMENQAIRYQLSQFHAMCTGSLSKV
jgi:hypothetical protein